MTLQTADRALQVLQQFHAPADALSVTEIADRLGVHRSTASRLVSTLRARGFLERTVGDLVRLGPEGAEERLRVVRAGADLRVVRLHDDAATVGPELLQREDDVLKTHGAGTLARPAPWIDPSGGPRMRSGYSASMRETTPLP